MPIKVPKGKKVRYRYRKLGPKRRQRLAFVNNVAVEVVGYRRKNGWVKCYTRRLPRKRRK